MNFVCVQGVSVIILKNMNSVSSLTLLLKSIYNIDIYFWTFQASREAILNRSSELSEARLHTFHNTTAVYDLLTIALVKRAQFSMLSQVCNVTCRCKIIK